MNFARPILVAALSTTAAGCYSAEVDPALEATYSCESDSDCAAGQTCVLQLCTDGSTPLGPSPEVFGPELLQVFPAGGEVLMPIVVGGAGLELGEGGGDNVAGEGSVDVYVDDELYETLVAGTLEARVQTAPLEVPNEPGLHRIEVVARQNDGSAYPNPEARAVSAFWVDDGREHIGFLRPTPNTEVVIGRGNELQIEVVTLNFTMLNPGFVDTEDLSKPGQGHIHVFFDRNIPDCLPDCNFNYESTGFPQMGETSSRLEVEGGVIGSQTEGTFPLEVVAQDSAHQPYYREGAPDDLLFEVINVLMVAQ